MKKRARLKKIMLFGNGLLWNGTSTNITRVFANSDPMYVTVPVRRILHLETKQSESNLGCGVGLENVDGKSWIDTIHEWIWDEKSLTTSTPKMDGVLRRSRNNYLYIFGAHGFGPSLPLLWGIQATRHWQTRWWSASGWPQTKFPGGWLWNRSFLKRWYPKMDGL